MNAPSLVVLAGLGGLALSSPVDAACFQPGTELPRREAVLAKVDHGQGGREIMDAVFAGDRAGVERLLARDPQLVRASDRRYDLLSVALGRCDREMVELLLRHGAPPDGPNAEIPLTLALRATTPWFAERLLAAGAKADHPEPKAPSPMYAAVLIGSRGAVRLLMDHGADPNLVDSVGTTPLALAASVGDFALAELMLGRGGDPFVADVNGGTPANLIPGAPEPTGEQAAARTRVVARLQALGAWPALAPEEVRVRVISGRWPPPGARSRPPSEAVVKQMRINWPHDGGRRG